MKKLVAKKTPNKNHLLEKTKNPFTANTKSHHTIVHSYTIKKYIKEKSTPKNQRTISKTHTFPPKKRYLRNIPRKNPTLKTKIPKIFKQKKSKHKLQKSPHWKDHINTTYKNIAHPKNNNNNKTNNKNSAPKPQTQPTTLPKIINQTQTFSTNQKPESNLFKNVHNMRYKNTTTAPYNESKPPTKPKIHIIKHPHHTHHKMQTSKTTTHKNKPTHNYTRNHKLTIIPTTTTYKKK
jgi:hypothetical protein